MALILAPEPPLNAWFAAFDEHLGRTAALFADRPIVADLMGAPAAGGRADFILQALDGLAARSLRVIGVEGVEAVLLAGTRWAQLPTILHGRRDSVVDEPGVAPETPLTGPTVAPPSLLVDRPVRSGQSIYRSEEHTSELQSP